MTHRFFDPAYLRLGNPRQRAAYDVLTDLRIFETLERYTPMLSGTIPLAIDIAGSDLDVLCEVDDFDGFTAILQTAYGGAPGFILSDIESDMDALYRTASFSHGGFIVEVFGQAFAVSKQRAYRHMIVQARLLDIGGAVLRSEIVTQRKSGLKTEPAFARHLGVTGDPYIALLELEKMSDSDLRRLLDDPPNAHRR